MQPYQMISVYEKHPTFKTYNLKHTNYVTARMWNMFSAQKKTVAAIMATCILSDILMLLFIRMSWLFLISMIDCRRRTNFVRKARK